MTKIHPSRKYFTHQAENGILTPVFAELPYRDPGTIYELISSPFSFLLESIKGPEKIARYSYVGYDPFLILKVKNGACELLNHKHQILPSCSPLSLIRSILKTCQVQGYEGIPPFTGGAVGLLSYDFVHYLERLPRTALDDLNIPDAHLLFIDTVIAFDHKIGKTYIIAVPGVRDKILHGHKQEADWQEAYEDSAKRISDLYNLIKQTRPGIGNHVPKGNARTVDVIHETEKSDYMEMVKRAKEYIRAGDIFQANLSQRVSAAIGNTRPWNIYRVLSSINPSPFASYLDMGDYYIVSSSPERLVRVTGNLIETRPIAGTRPRGKDAEGDKLMRADLLLNEKERAEHLMLIDLERNDLGKIADYSTVEVDELMITEDYSHVIHIVSNIKGTIVKGRDCFDAIRATFPGGTITGVPKVRCMEIIDELEPVVRGPYTGSVGFIGFNGNMDLNIIIRTFVIKNGIAYVQAGAGIVADSDPECEYYETLKKAEALTKTLKII